ncbi:MAG: VIT domain-containing protein, partial [Planctomycetota bacterium]
MLRTFLAALCATLLSALFVAIATPAHANGILVGAHDADTTTTARATPVRLKGHRVEATIRDGVAEVRVEQVFHNGSGSQLEGTYLFPLPEGAVVSDFAMTMGGQMVRGEVVEAQQARRIYEDIVRRRRDPGLLEWVGRGLFRARVFPIEPQSDLTIRLAFQQVLAEDAGTLEFRYPLATNRFHGASVESVVVDVNVESSVDLKAIYSPSHRLDVTRDGERRARITYERGGARQDRDFLLYLARSPDAVGFSFLSHRNAGEDGTFMAVLAPGTERREEDRVPKDVVYVIDTSGSMRGPKIEQARDALTYGVRMLHPGDRFNVIGFSTGVRTFRDRFVEATPDVVEAAAGWLQGLEAAGGTNIEGAIVEALRRGGRDRLLLVVFVTDGAPTVGETDPDALVRRTVVDNTSHARIFTFGVGFDLDVKLLDRIAEATGGRRDYVTPDEDIEIATGRFFRKVDQPVLSDVRVTFGEGVHDVYPQRLPDVFAGEQLVLFGRYET